MTDQQAAALLPAVRNYLDITWTDASLDQKLTGMILRGAVHIDDTGGTTYDYTVEGQARGLLFDYVRYARSHALEDFWINYKHELLALRLAREVADYEAE